MTNEELFALWAPAEARWSAWAKPVLFAQMDTSEALGPGLDSTPPAQDFFWLPDADGQSALVIDLPGADSVNAGLAAARRGYRPVPLYNTSLGPAAVIDAAPVARALIQGADSLRRQALPRTAPPAFLLDARRTSPAAPPAPGQFDNRWVVFLQDFPSATRMQSSGIAEVVVLMERGEPPTDLSQVLQRWQQSGIRILAASPQAPGRMTPITVRAPGRLRGLWSRMLVAAGLMRSSAGGFGGIVPRPGSGG